jgi:hypothetical protein
MKGAELKFQTEIQDNARVINKTLNDVWLLTERFKTFATICKGLIDVLGYELKENFCIINLKK